MDNIDKLIQIYCYICQCYNSNLSLHFQRTSNHFQPKFTDQEVLTIFFYCFIVEKRMEIKDIYQFANDYLRTWFPDLGKTYESYLHRINKLHSVFPLLIEIITQQKMKATPIEEFKLFNQLFFSLIDSMPIIVANGNRSGSATVASDMCDKGYCSSKKMYYYGVKLHVLGFSIFKKLPIPEFVATSPASNNDLSVAKFVFECLKDRVIFADKIYGNKEFEEYLKKYNNLHILKPVKKKKGQEFLEAADNYYSTTVSQVRQPIEAFFSWIIEKTGIQKASKIRSSKGLLTHVFGRFAAAMMIMCFDFL